MFNVEEIVNPHEKEIASLPKHKPEMAAAAANLLYVIYTSGSTGNPKGVLVNHRGFVNLVYFYQKIFGQCSSIRMSQVASPGFDAMAFELWPCLTFGAALYIANNETQMDLRLMRGWLIDSRINISYQPTVMAELLLEEEWPEGGVLEAVMAAGDKLTRVPTRQ
jgi:non-ribosomal peptide synthetase component F